MAYIAIAYSPNSTNASQSLSDAITKLGIATSWLSKTLKISASLGIIASFPLLQEYFYHDSKRLSAVIGSEFMQPMDIRDIPDTLKDFRGIETQYEIADLQGDDFTEALSKIA